MLRTTTAPNIKRSLKPKVLFEAAAVDNNEKVSRAVLAVAKTNANKQQQHK